MDNILCLNFLDLLKTIVPLANLLIVVFVFNYTRKKDKKEIKRSQKLEEQKIQLQWFKYLILEPNMSLVNKFYEDITVSLNNLLNIGNQDIDLIKISSDVKAEHAKIRKSFVDVLRIADTKLEDKIKLNLDNLIGELDTTIFDKGINLSHVPAFEKEIISRVIYSKNDLISAIYSYKGIVE